MTILGLIPPIEELIPHRGTMRLLDRLLEFQGETAVAEYVPKADAWYVDHEGNMPAWIGIELMAQAVAAHVAMTKRRQELPPQMGALLGTRSFACSTKSFAVGKVLSVRVRMLFRDPGGMSAYDCTIEQKGETRATSTLKVFEPDDFERFVQGRN